MSASINDTRIKVQKKIREPSTEAYDPHFPKQRTTDQNVDPENTSKKPFTPYFSTRVR